MRFAYADPPYPGQSRRLYGSHPDYAGEVDHPALIARLCLDFPDGWALSTSTPSLRELLPLCPPKTRVLAWMRTDAPPKTVRVQYAWEAVLLAGGRPYQGGPRVTRDTLIASSGAAMGPGILRDRIEHITGRKPPRFCRWLFDCLGAEPGDELVDLFPGSGAVGKEWEHFCAQMMLPLAPQPHQEELA